MEAYPRVESTRFALEMRGISKRFGPVKALDDVTLRVPAGTVHALVGENGAGKSTLMKILSGVHQPDTGTIVRQGKTCVWKHPSDSLAAGVAMIYQELSLAPDLTIAENVWLGIEPRGPFPGTYSKKRMLADTRALAEKTRIRCGSRSKGGEPSRKHVPDCRGAEGPRAKCRDSGDG